MNETIKALPTALRMILTDPVNLVMAVIPALVSLALYIVTITLLVKNNDMVIALVKTYVPFTADYATGIGWVLVALMVVFVFIVMNFTFIMVVGIISSPFNSMISSRIESKLVGKPVSSDSSKTFKDMLEALAGTLFNELKKLAFILILSVAAFFLNLVPFFYPVALMMFCLLIAIQFLDFSWSRHDWTFGTCFKDVFSNFFTYGIAGLLFLGLMMIPVINSVVPSLATSYFTVLWLHRQNKLPSPQ